MQKNKIKYIISLLIWFFGGFVSAQTVSIPDLAFREYLKGIYPFLMKGDKMILNRTHDVVGAFNIQGLGVKDLEGIQYLTNITSLNISYNEIQNIPKDIYRLKKLKEFTAIGCGLKECPNFRNMPDLQVLYLSVNHLKNINKFIDLPLLEELYLDNNKLEELTPAVNNCLALKVLTVNDNQLTNLPFLSELDSMEVFSVYNNKLSFEDLEPLSHLFSVSVIQKYLFPQSEIKIKDHYIDIPEGNSLSIQLPMYSPNSIYNWYHNGHYLRTTTTNTLKLDSITLNKAGTYYCEIENKLRVFRNNYLTTSRVSINVDTCIKYTDIEYEILEEFTCLHPGVVSIESIGLESDYDVKYLVKGINHDYEELLNDDNSTFQINSGGSFSVTLTANYGKCIRDIEKILTIDSLDCPKHMGNMLQFSPNNDGENDHFLLNYIGEVKIYDRDAKLVRQLNAPVYWDGLDNYSKELTTGLYFIYIEEDTLLEVTLIR